MFRIHRRLLARRTSPSRSSSTIFPPRLLLSRPTRPAVASAAGGGVTARVDSLLRNQVEAIEHIRAVRDVAVSHRGSGKSLIYYLPTVESLASGGGHSLYRSRQALEQDSREAERFGLACSASRSELEIYDCDTHRSSGERSAPPSRHPGPNPTPHIRATRLFSPEWAGFFRSRGWCPR